MNSRLTVDKSWSQAAYESIGDAASHHVGLILRLEGQLDEDRLCHALRGVFETHAMLRARVSRQAGLALRVDSELPSAWWHVETLDAHDLEPALQRAIAERFELERGSARARLFHTGSLSHFLVVTVHRLACDESSLETIHRDILQAYAGASRILEFSRAVDAQSAGNPATGSESGPEELNQKLERYRALLGGEIPVLELPFDRPRGSGGFSGNGRTLGMAAPIELLRDVRRLAERENIALEDVLLTAYLAVLQRYSNQDDVSVGVAVRSSPDGHENVGSSDDFWLLRSPVPATATVREALRRVAAVAAPERVGSKASFAEVLDAVAPHIARQTPLFQVAFELEPPYLDPQELDGVMFVREPVVASGARSELRLRIRPQRESLSVSLEYATDLFDESSARRLLDSYLVLLEALIHAPDTALGALPALTEEERQRAVSAISRAEYEADRPAHVRFEEHARQTPQAPAVVFNGTTVSYAELDRRANRLARRLVEQGVVEDALVGIYCERSVDMVTAVLAVLKAGGAYVPLDPSHPATRIQAILEDAAPALVITQNALVQTCPAAAGTKLVCTDAPDLDALSDAPLGIQTSQQALAYVIFTSGSTGRPKGVEIPRRAFTNFIVSMAREPGMRPSDRILSVTTLSFDIAGLELLLPLSVGASLEVADRATCLDGVRLSERLSDPAITMLQATPATFRLLVESGWEGKKELRILCGGEAFPPDLVGALLRRVGEVWNVYGPTETTVWSTAHRLERETTPISIGRPIANTSIYLLNALAQPVPFGAIGEICIGGDGVARGYRGKPELTRERFIPDPYYGRDDARMYRTGDLGRFLPDGTLVCLGRIDFQVKIRGFRIELGDIESALLDCEEVRQAVVTVREEQPGDKRLIAYVVPNVEGDENVSMSLRRALQTRLPEYMLPSRFVYLDALPLNPSGKIDRKALPAPTTVAPSAPVGDRPSNDLEVMLHTAFTEVLRVPHLDVNQSFFDAGGDSLSAVRLLRRIEADLHRDIPLSALFDAPSIRGLAQSLHGESGPEKPHAVLVRRGTGARRVFCVFGVALYLHLAEALPEDVSVYGVVVPVEARLYSPENLQQGRVEYQSVPELAGAYIEAMRALQPEGPYYVVGSSFGGVIAYEIARQLREAGQEVGMVAMLDPLLPAAVQVSRLRKLWHRFRRPPTLLSAGAKLLLARLGKGQRLTWSDDELAALRDFVNELQVSQYLRSECSYEGDTMIFNALDRSDYHGLRVDAAAGWDRLVRGKIMRFDVPGTHMGVLQPPHVSAIAEKVTLALRSWALAAAAATFVRLAEPLANGSIMSCLG